jgi:hypothetical protein
MTVTDMESRIKYLELELERTLYELEREIANEHGDPEPRKALKISVGKILLELGALQTRLAPPPAAS